MGNIIRRPYPGREARTMFTVQQFITHYELIPLAIPMALKVMAVPFMIWTSFRTKDIVYDRRIKPVNERMDLLHPYYLKLYWINEVWRPRDDLHEAYTEMRKAQHKAEADAKARLKKPKHGN